MLFWYTCTCPINFRIYFGFIDQIPNINDLTRTILYLCTQDNGKHLLAVDDGNDHNLSVWDVGSDKKFHKMAECKVSTKINMWAYQQVALIVIELFKPYCLVKVIWL